MSLIVKKEMTAKVHFRAIRSTAALIASMIWASEVELDEVLTVTICDTHLVISILDRGVIEITIPASDPAVVRLNGKYGKLQAQEHVLSLAAVLTLLPNGNYS